jgi:hypothetical protein
MFLRHHYDLRHRGWHSVPSADVTAPTITTGPTVSGVTDVRATVAWTLGEAGTGQVGYGLADPSSGTPGTITVVSTDVRIGTTAYVSVPRAAVSLAAGDVVVIVMGKPRAVGLFAQVAPTSGWTLEGNEQATGPSPDQTRVVAVKRITAPGSEPTSWEFDRGSSGEQYWSAITLVLRGVDPLDTLDAAIVTANGNDDLTPDAPDVTTVTANALVVTGHFSGTAYADRSSSVTPGAPSGFTLVGMAAQVMCLLAVAYRTEATAGAKTYGSWTHSPDNAGDDYQTFTLAIRPAPGGGVSGVRASDYDALSTLEQRLLTAHSQALSGLAPFTTYHYAVESADAVGNVVVSADATFATQAAGGGGGTPGGYPTSQTGLAYVAWGGSMAEPGYLVEVQDPNFEGSITRITPDGQTWRTAYPKVAMWNADGSRIAFAYWGRLLDGVTYADLGSLSGVPSSRVAWSMVDPNFMWSTAGNRLYRYYPMQGTSVIHRTFSQFSSVDLGAAEGRPDMNDRYVPLACNSKSVFVMYDAQADAIVGQVTLPSAMDWCGVSTLGQYGIVRFSASGSGSGQGVWLYTLTCQPIRNIASGGHGDVVLGPSGEDVYVGTWDPGGGTRWNAVYLATNVRRDVAFGSGNGHVSGIAIGRPGWVYLSDHIVNTSPGFDQVWACKVDGSLETQVFCHARTTQTSAQFNYAQTTFATPNRDGTLVSWGGGWERATNGTANNRGYIVRIAP